MNYPIWDLTTIGGGSLIALIAVLHVYISHLAVGGGLFLWLTDRAAVRRGDAPLLEYVRTHTWFFLLLTMVFGGVTGVGIWFIIALVQPAATSSLIHTFVFGWAIEWVFFVGEIVALLIYHYRFTRLTEKDRLRVAFLYFLFAWLSMVIINGILSFMLTPGSWLETREFWDGFFNPTYWSSLVFRTSMAAILAGLFGTVTAVFTADAAFRARLLRWCAGWLVWPFVILVPAAAWYYLSVPTAIRETAFALNPQAGPFLQAFVGSSAVLFLAGLFLLRRTSLPVQRTVTTLLLVIGLGWIGGFEYMREIARKPWIIGNHMYGTSVSLADVALLNREGMLRHARWTAVREITDSTRTEAGRELFRLQCQSCHTLHGIRNDIAPRIAPFTYTGILAHLTGQGKVQTYMPPFIGTAEEKEALAYYLTTMVNGSEAEPAPTSGSMTGGPVPVPPYDSRTDDHILLAWNDLGMHCLTDGDAWFSFLPPANTLEAQLIRRGDPPVILHEGIELVYAVEPGFENPSAHTDFWKFAESLYGRKLPVNTGLTGNGLTGTFTFDAERGSFIASAIPVLPYKDDGSYNPYPVFTVEARDRASGKVIASTKVVAPVSTEIGCRNCHGGPWRRSGSGLSDLTARNILAAHDRLNHTDLLGEAGRGAPRSCQSCHPDPVLAAPGTPDVLDLSTAMHGWHALYMPFDDARSCNLCHPGHTAGNTRCLRDPHSALGMDCISCHGTMTEDAVALLKGEAAKPAAQRLLRAVTGVDTAGINPRTAWHGQTDCLVCHEEFEAPTGDSGFNTWTTRPEDLYRMRTDYAGVRCPACHGPTHAMYPSFNPIERDRDNIQPLQYGRSRAPIGSDMNCAVCHRKPMADPLHHPNMARPFRNTDLLN